MIKKVMPIAMAAAIFAGATGCKNDSGFKKTHGIAYKIIKDVPGKNAQVGDIVEFNIVVKADTTEIANSYKNNGGHPAVTRVEEVKQSGQFQAVFPYLSAGDSAVVEISCDTMLKSIPPAQLQSGQLPPWLKKGKKVVLNVSVVSVKSMDDYKKEMEKKKADQTASDDKQIQDYIAKNNLKAQKTESGVYYVITKEGTGANIAKRQVASLKYTGKLLDGKTFDSNIDTTFHHAEPLTVNVGMGSVIPGMDQGLQQLKKGSKATLIIPSTLGYGPQASEQIPANSVLVFDIDVLDVKAAPAQPQQEMPMQAVK